MKRYANNLMAHCVFLRNARPQHRQFTVHVYVSCSLEKNEAEIKVVSFPYWSSQSRPIEHVLLVQVWYEKYENSTLVNR